MTVTGVGVSYPLRAIREPVTITSLAAASGAAVWAKAGAANAEPRLRIDSARAPVIDVKTTIGPVALLRILGP
jgi:hypothetical protein